MMGAVCVQMHMQMCDLLNLVYLFTINLVLHHNHKKYESFHDGITDLVNAIFAKSKQCQTVKSDISFLLFLSHLTVVHVNMTGQNLTKKKAKMEMKMKLRISSLLARPPKMQTPKMLAQKMPVPRTVRSAMYEL